MITSGSFIGEKTESTLLAGNGNLTSFVQLSAFAFSCLKYRACIIHPFKLFQGVYVASPYNLRSFTDNSLETDNDLVLRTSRQSQTWLFSFRLLLGFCKTCS